MSKSVASHLQAVAVGPTFLDLDLERSARALSIGRKDQPAFCQSAKVADPGRFTMLGRAVSKVRIDVDIGEVQTHHPAPGEGKRATEPPPTPAQIKKLLADLASIPKEAERKQRTEAELRAEIAKLREQLAAAPVQEEAEVQATVQKWTDIVEQQRGEISMLESNLKMERDQNRVMDSAFRKMRDAMVAEVAAFEDRWKRSVADAPQAKTFFLNETHELPRGDRRPATNGAPAPRPPRPAPAGGAAGPASGLCARRILGVLNAKAPRAVPRDLLAVLTGYQPSGGGFGNAIGGLRSAGLIEDDGSGFTLTQAGVEVPYERVDVTPATVVEMWQGKLTGRGRDMLTLLARAKGPLTRAQIATDVAMDASGGGFGNYIGALKSNGLIRQTRGGFEAVPAVRMP